MSSRGACCSGAAALAATRANGRAAALGGRGGEGALYAPTPKHLQPRGPPRSSVLDHQPSQRTWQRRPGDRRRLGCWGVCRCSGIPYTAASHSDAEVPEDGVVEAFPKNHYSCKIQKRWKVSSIEFLSAIVQLGFGRRPPRCAHQPRVDRPKGHLVRLPCAAAPAEGASRAPGGSLSCPTATKAQGGGEKARSSGALPSS